MHVTCSVQWQPHRKLSINVSSAEGALAPVLMKLTAGDTVVSDTKGCSDLKAWVPSHGTLPTLASLLSSHHSLPSCRLYAPYLVKWPLSSHEGLPFPLCRSRDCGLERCQHVTKLVWWHHVAGGTKMKRAPAWDSSQQPPRP